MSSNLSVIAGLYLMMFGFLAMINVASAGDDAAAEKSRAAVESWLKDLSKRAGAVGEPKITPVDQEVRAVLPNDRFYSIQFMRYPRAVKPPAPLQLGNLVRVSADGTVERIEGSAGLKKLFAKKLASANSQDETRAILLACLHLGEELYQDGYYVFEIRDKDISVVRHGDHWVATGKATVKKEGGGGSGYVTVTVKTGSRGDITVSSHLKPGVRLR